MTNNLKHFDFFYLLVYSKNHSKSVCRDFPIVSFEQLHSIPSSKRTLILQLLVMDI